MFVVGVKRCATCDGAVRHDVGGGGGGDWQVEQAVNQHVREYCDGRVQ